MYSVPEYVRISADFIAKNATHVKINAEKLSSFANWVTEHKDYDELESSSLHPTSADFSLEELVKFYFLVDTLNFCFWHNEMEYEQLVLLIKKIMKEDSTFFTADKFKNVTIEEFEAVFKPVFKDHKGQLPERQRLVMETLGIVKKRFGNSFLEVLKSAEFDALKLLRVLANYWTGFQDHAIYKGRQVGFYKRAQILAGDVKEALQAYKRSGIVRDSVEKTWLDCIPTEGLTNAVKMTCFPDYRVPQVLREFGVLVYSEALSNIVDSKGEITAGSEMESEIRGSMVQAVSELSKMTSLSEIQIDWILWQYGEKNLAKLGPHHRTLTIFY